jgi:dolichol-phosphate mannosyltransferase
MSTGLRNLVNLRRRPDVVATMDADNTHDPSQILTMVREIERGADVVICSRYASGASTVGVPGYRVLLSAGARFLFGVLVGASGVQDYTSGYRVYRMDVVDRLTREFRPLVRARGFAVQTEILAKAAALGSRFSEVAMQLRYDLKPGRSKLRLVPTLIEYVRVVTLTKIDAMRISP